MSVGGRALLVSVLAVFVRRGRVMLGVLMLAARVVMLRLVMVMRGGVVVRGRLVMMLGRWMLGCLCHFDVFLSAILSALYAAERRDVAGAI